MMGTLALNELKGLQGSFASWNKRIKRIKKDCKAVRLKGLNVGLKGLN